MADTSDSAGTATWDDASSQRWLRSLDSREASLTPVLDALFGRAALHTGERVLDVGCGAGPSTRTAARLVGPGRVTGVDLSPDLIAAARERSADVTVEWLIADVQTAVLPAAAYDAVISRFGVMFFADPVRAFTNLAASCRPGGRLAVAVWPVRGESEFHSRPLEVLTRTFTRLGLDLQLPPDDRGPFSLGHRSETAQLLDAAGWVDVEITQDQRPLYPGGPGATDEQAVDFCLGLGAVNLVLAEQPAAVVAAVRGDLLACVGHWRDDVGVALPGGVLIVTARSGAPALDGPQR